MWIQNILSNVARSVIGEPKDKLKEEFEPKTEVQTEPDPPVGIHAAIDKARVGDYLRSTAWLTIREYIIEHCHQVVISENGPMKRKIREGGDKFQVGYHCGVIEGAEKFKGYILALREIIEAKQTMKKGVRHG